MFICYTVPSQCLVTNTAQRLQKKGQLASYATKVGLQMEVKLGADAWAVQAPFERVGRSCALSVSGTLLR